MKAPYDRKQEEIFNELVKVPINYTTYLEKGMNFIKFQKDGKKYQITIKEIK